MKAEGCAAAGPSSGGQRSTLFLHESSRDVQTESATGTLGATATTFECRFACRSWNTEAAIFDVERRESFA